MNGPTFTSPRSTPKKATTPEVDADPDPLKEMARATTAVVHLTPEERAARGKAARAEVPRSSHAGWEAPPGRPDPAEELGVQDFAPVNALHRALDRGIGSADLGQNEYIGWLSQAHWLKDLLSQSVCHCLLLDGARP